MMRSEARRGRKPVAQILVPLRQKLQVHGDHKRRTTGIARPVEVVKHGQYTATLYDLLSAYAGMRQHNAVSVVHVRAREVWSLQDAREALTRMIGRIAEWTPMEVLMSPYAASTGMKRSVAASAFGASLELVREGKIELRQTEHFQPLYVRDRPPAVALVTPEDGHG